MSRETEQQAQAARSVLRRMLRAPVAVLANTTFWLVLAWNALILNPAMAEEGFVEPKLLYILDAGQMSVAEQRPGMTDPEQMRVYLSMLGQPISSAAAAADPSLVLMAAMHADGLAGDAIHADTLYAAAGQVPDAVQTAAGYIGEPGIMPRSQLGADGVWEFPRVPDVDERDMLVGEKWRIVENDESQLLFLGPDRQFGFDDFIDIVNPLQHIPLVNIAYRAVTGDEIYGAARLVDAGFGPAAGVSTVFDLAYTSTNGQSMEDTAMAALFGPSPADTANMAQVIYYEEDGIQISDSRTRRGSIQ